MRTVAASLVLFLVFTLEALSDSQWKKVDIVADLGINPGAALNSITTAGNLVLSSVSSDPLYKVVRSTDAGISWSTGLNLAPLKLKSLSSIFLYGVRSDSIMTTPNQGLSPWNVLRPALNMTLADVHYINSSPGQAWAVGDSPYVSITTNNWSTSNNVRFQVVDSVSMSSVQFFDNNFGFVTGRSTKAGSKASVILGTTDGGLNWQDRSLPDICSSSLTRIVTDFASPLTGWAVQTCGATANFYKTTDGGSTWSLQDSKPLFLAYAIDAVDSLYAWVSGQSGAGGEIAGTSNGGGIWNVTQPPSASPLFSIAMSDTANGFACGQAATLLVYSPVGTDVPGERTNRPRSFELSQNYPNPFNGETRIVFTLQKSQPVTLTVYNILGQPVRKLLDGKRPAGKNEASWDGRDERGLSVPSGIYLYKLSTPDEKDVRKMVLLK